jgi:hypothetical protein
MSMSKFLGDKSAFEEDQTQYNLGKQYAIFLLDLQFYRFDS